MYLEVVIVVIVIVIFMMCLNDRVRKSEKSAIVFTRNDGDTVVPSSDIMGVPLSGPVCPRSQKEFCPYRMLVGNWKLNDMHQEYRIRTNPRNSDMLVLDFYQTGNLMFSKNMDYFRCESESSPGDLRIVASVDGVDKEYTIKSHTHGVFLNDGTGNWFKLD